VLAYGANKNGFLTSQYPEYPFAQYNTPLDIVDYTEDEYGAYLEGIVY
jgi:hypothetical protein